MNSNDSRLILHIISLHCPSDRPNRLNISNSSVKHKIKPDNKYINQYSESRKLQKRREYFRIINASLSAHRRCSFSSPLFANHRVDYITCLDVRLLTNSEAFRATTITYETLHNHFKKTLCGITKRSNGRTNLSFPSPKMFSFDFQCSAIEMFSEAKPRLAKAKCFPTKCETMRGRFTRLENVHEVHAHTRSLMKLTTVSRMTTLILSCC